MTVVRMPFIRAPYDAFQVGNTTFVRPKQVRNACLLAHEAQHGKEQLAMGVVKWWWCYLTDMDFKLRAEARAYTVSMRNGMKLTEAINWLRTYDNTLTVERAAELLQQESVNV